MQGRVTVQWEQMYPVQVYQSLRWLAVSTLFACRGVYRGQSTHLGLVWIEMGCQYWLNALRYKHQTSVIGRAEWLYQESRKRSMSCVAGLWEIGAGLQRGPGMESV